MGSKSPVQLRPEEILSQAKVLIRRIENTQKDLSHFLQHAANIYAPKKVGDVVKVTNTRMYYDHNMLIERVELKLFRKKTRLIARWYYHGRILSSRGEPTWRSWTIFHDILENTV